MQADSGIYVIRCLPTDRVYIGSSLHISTRWAEHRSALTRGSHHNVALMDDWKRYGPAAFEFALLEAVTPPPADALATAERRHIALLRANDPAFGYNGGGVSRSDPAQATRRDLVGIDNELVEAAGAWCRRRWPVGEIGGRLLGLLIVADEDLSLDDLVITLRVSRASIYLYIRLVMMLGLAERVTHPGPGDRRDYYRFAHNAWERALLADIEGTMMFRKLGERGLAAVRGSEGPATERLEGLIEFCDMALEDRQVTLKRWRERHPSK